VTTWREVIGMLSTDTGHLACEQQPELWFSPEPEDIQSAKQLCLPCSRREVCLSECLVLEDLLGQQLVGVHGGLTPAERNRLR
jgi:hypothetical protein